MPFGLKRTTGISGHYSEAWAIAPRLGVEACMSQWKLVEDVEDVGKHWKMSGSSGRQVEDRKGVGRGVGGLEEVWKAVGECRRDRKAQEGNTTLHL